MKGKSVTLNYIYNLFYQILAMVIILITTPYVSRVLGVHNIGTYGYTFSYVTFFVLLGTLGVTIYGQREIAYVYNDKKKRSIAFWEIKILHFISMAISLVLYFLIFCIKGSYVVYFRILLFEIIAYSLDITWFLQGLEEFKKTVFRNTIVRILGLILIFLLVRTENDLWKYIFIIVFVDILGFGTLWAYLPKYIEKIKLSELNLKKRLIPMVTLFLPQIAVQVYTILDKSMIGLILKDMKEVGYYEQAQRILKTMLTVITSMGTVILSRMSIYVAKKEEKEVNKCLIKTIEFVFFVGIPMTFGICAISSKLIPWFLGKGYEPVSEVLVTMSPIILIIGLTNIIGAQYLVSMKRQKEYTISIVMGCITNIVLNSFLIYFFHAKGAAIASVVAEAVVLIIQYFYIKEIIKIKYLIKKIYKYILSGTVMFIVLTYVDKFVLIEKSLINTLIQIITGTIIYVIVLSLLKNNIVNNNLKKIYNNFH